MERSHGIDSLSLIMKYTPSLADYGYGRDYLMIPFYAFFPRFAWPHSWGPKPYNSAVDFGRAYFTGVEDSHSYNVSIGQFNIGDLYRNLGWPGVICGMFCLGVLYRCLYTYIHSYEKSDRAVVIVLYSVFIMEVMHGMEGDVTSMAGSLLKRIALLFPVYWYLRSRVRSKSRPLVTTAVPALTALRTKYTLRLARRADLRAS
jgi:hypothetical protein